MGYPCRFRIYCYVVSLLFVVEMFTLLRHTLAPTGTLSAAARSPYFLHYLPSLARIGSPRSCPTSSHSRGAAQRWRLAQIGNSMRGQILYDCLHKQWDRDPASEWPKGYKF
ncbi:hypothetical protein EDB86DRAFT_1533912 [Lactarius hatsudake]|nr:hypothetical protein EDB86DRAFT_1533912 [Lactarius hatsudake]